MGSDKERSEYFHQLRRSLIRWTIMAMVYITKVTSSSLTRSMLLLFFKIIDQPKHGPYYKKANQTQADPKCNLQFIHLIRYPSVPGGHLFETNLTLDKRPSCLSFMLIFFSNKGAPQ